MPAARRLPAALALAAALVFASPAASPAVTCHCFKDREFDPAHPASSDEFLLATAGNSLLAAAYGIPKGDIVRALMSGTAGADLWVSTYAGSCLHRDPAALRSARGAAGRWREVLGAGAGPGSAFGPLFSSALAAGADDAALARAAAAETLAARAGTPRAELEELAARGATLQETVLAALLGKWSKRPAPAVLAEARSGQAPWSALLHRLGLVPKDVEGEIARTIR